MTPRLFGTLNLVVAAFFVLFTLVQYNDPDPLFWMVVYSGTALACVLYRLERLPPAVAAGYGVLALLLGLYLAYRVISQGQFIFDEEGREMMGSFLVAIWRGVLYRRSVQRQRNAEGATVEERG